MLWLVFFLPRCSPGWPSSLSIGGAKGWAAGRCAQLSDFLACGGFSRLVPHLFRADVCMVLTLLTASPWPWRTSGEQPRHEDWCRRAGYLCEDVNRPSEPGLFVLMSIGGECRCQPIRSPPRATTCRVAPRQGRPRSSPRNTARSRFVSCRHDFRGMLRPDQRAMHVLQLLAGTTSSAR